MIIIVVIIMVTVKVIVMALASECGDHVDDDDNSITNNSNIINDNRKRVLRATTSMADMALGVPPVRRRSLAHAAQSSAAVTDTAAVEATVTTETDSACNSDE